MLTGLSLLRESIKALLFEDLASHNATELSKGINSYDGGRSLHRFDEDKIIENLLKRIPQLQNHRIDFIQGGTEGAAFEMDNGHILKILFEKSPWEKQQIASYMKIQRELHKGTGRRSDIMVYDVGNTKSPFYFHYIEMEKVKTFFEWSRTSPDARGMYEVVSWMADEVHKWDYGSTASRPKTMDNAIWKLIHAVRNKNIRITAYKSKQKSIINSLAVTMARHFLEGRSLDIHAGNLGVIEKRGKPPVFVFFDF